jgi:hypothetical protein
MTSYGPRGFTLRPVKLDREISEGHSGKFPSKWALSRGQDTQGSYSARENSEFRLDFRFGEWRFQDPQCVVGVLDKRRMR